MLVGVAEKNIFLSQHNWAINSSVSRSSTNRWKEREWGEGGGGCVLHVCVTHMALCSHVLAGDDVNRHPLLKQ